jgi:hypothetical protein
MGMISKKETSGCSGDFSKDVAAIKTSN